MVERVVQHSDNLATLVVDDTLLLLVIKCGHSETTLVVLVVLEVDITKVGVTFVQRIGSGVLSRNVLIRLCESPSYGGQSS